MEMAGLGPEFCRPTVWGHLHHAFAGLVCACVFVCVFLNKLCASVSGWQASGGSFFERYMRLLENDRFFVCVCACVFFL